MKEFPVPPHDADSALIAHFGRPTALVELGALSAAVGVRRVVAKAEWQRALGNFKSLGGMLAGLRALARCAGVESIGERVGTQPSPIVLPRLICASDGNHGLAVAAAARRVGARATVYLPIGVGRQRAARIEAMGGDISWAAGTYDDAVNEAAAAARRGEGLLIADTSVDPDDRVVRDVMEGYAVMTDEIVAQFRQQNVERLTHVFVQAGVGGLAAALATGLRGLMAPSTTLVVVEPKSAACVARALACGKPVQIDGDLSSCADMLSCGMASAPALAVLLRHGAAAVQVNEPELSGAVDMLWRLHGVATTASGAAGLAGMLKVASEPRLRDQYRLRAESVVMIVITEGADAEGMPG